MPEGGSATAIAFLTLGCKVNQTESEAIAEALGVGCSTADADHADVVVINTCTVTAEADHKARKAVRHALGLPQSPIVVVTGCLASVDAASLRALGGRVIVEPDKSRVPTRIREVTGEGLRVGEYGGSAGRARMQLKVQDGCDQFCSYCIVPYARGVPRPVPFEDVVARARRLVAAGTAEIVLTGINIGKYDDGQRQLPEVVSAVAATGVRRLRISSIEPGDVTDAFLAMAAELPAFCRHLHVPLQSGADTVLNRMGRPYDTASFAATVARIHAVLPGCALTTDVIVGFPGETDAEFAETLAFVEAQGFSRLHVFRYSPRPGTPAATMPAHVSPQVKSARAGALRELGDRLAAEYARSRAGRRDELLVERVVAGSAGERLAEGTTREYLHVRVPTAASGVAPGSLLEIEIEGVSCDGAVQARVLP